MTYSCGSTVTACPKVQESLNAIFGLDPMALREDSRFIKYITSGVNTNNVLQNQIDQGNSRRRMVELVYQPRLVTGTSSTSVGITCKSGDEPCDLSQIYEIDETQGSSKIWSIDLSKLEEACEDDEFYVGREFARVIDLLTRDINRRTVQQAAGLIGNSAVSGNSNPISTATSAGSDCCDGKVTTLIEDVDFEFTEMEWNGPVVLFGGDKTWKNYWKSLEVACCNDVGENLQEFMRMHEQVPFYDREFRTYLNNADGFLGMIPRALQLLTFNAHRGSRGIREVDTETFKKGVIAHPNPEVNLLFDYYAELKCNKWNFYLGLAHQLVGAPDDMFFTNDRLDGINGVLEFDINNPA